MARLYLKRVHTQFCCGNRGLDRHSFSIVRIHNVSTTLKVNSLCFQFSHSVVSDSLQPHGPQHTRPPHPSPTPGVYSNSCPLSQWCHPAISSSVIPFSSRLQSFPESGSFPVSQFFSPGGQSVGVSASASVLPMNIQDWFPSGWAGWISLQSTGLSRVFSNTTVQKHQFFGAQLSLWFSSFIFRSLSYRTKCVCAVTSVESGSLWPYGPWPARLLCPWDSPYCSGLPCPPPRDLSQQRIKTVALATTILTVDSLRLSHQGSP